MTLLFFLILCVIFLAYSNGANDNFKGVATLFGCGATNYKIAIWWATITTFAGSIASVFLAAELIKIFSGKGLVPDAIATSPLFLTSVALGAALTVLLSALRGLPISTTHALTGALVGAGFAAIGMDVNFSQLGSKFFFPLIASPFIALASAALLYVVFRTIRLKMGISEEWCLCVGQKEEVVPIPQPHHAMAAHNPTMPELSFDTGTSCQRRYNGHFKGFPVQKILDSAHFFSAGIVSFARGLNDTPKIVGLLVAAQALQIEYGLLIVGVAMAIGGLFNARLIAETMSKKITSMNHGQGFTANLVTGLLVIFASRWGVPVSTTHVSVGSIFGIGAITRNIDTKIAGGIFLSWLLTLPVAAALSATVYFLLGLF